MSTRETLTPELLIAAYSAGFFPMADMRKSRRGTRPRIGWYSPDPRAILSLEPGGLHIPRSLARTLRRGEFEVTFDECFQQVMVECAKPRSTDGDDGCWISPEMIDAYTALHRRGNAHSVEAWVGKAESRRLVGGLYGVSIGAAFFAESMFCRPELGGTDASKVCLVALVHALQAAGYVVLDVQMANPHTEQFGVVEIPRNAFQAILEAAVRAPANWR